LRAIGSNRTGLALDARGARGAGHAKARRALCSGCTGRSNGTSDDRRDGHRRSAHVVHGATTATVVAPAVAATVTVISASAAHGKLG
jgi:hypothetical protein